jgi:hypothetical protein
MESSSEYVHQQFASSQEEMVPQVWLGEYALSKQQKCFILQNLYKYAVIKRLKKK